MRRTRHYHLHRLSQADVLLDVHQLRRHPHEVARVGVVRLVERVAAVEAGMAADDEDAALRLAVVVHRRCAAGRELDVPQPDFFRANGPLRNTGFAQHRAAGQLVLPLIGMDDLESGRRGGHVINSRR